MGYWTPTPSYQLFYAIPVAVLLVCFIYYWEKLERKKEKSVFYLPRYDFNIGMIGILLIPIVFIGIGMEIKEIGQKVIEIAPGIILKRILLWPLIVTVASSGLYLLRDEIEKELNCC